MSALTKYLDLSQDLMQHYQTHFSRVAHLSYTRAQVEHGRTLDSVYAAHEEGMGVCEKVLKMKGLSYNFQKQLGESLTSSSYSRKNQKSIFLTPKAPTKTNFELPPKNFEKEK